MKLIKQITDYDIIGTTELSNAKPRLTARAILKNKEDRYALLYSEDFGLYSFPGGGIKEKESVLSALKREITEETGCSCDSIDDLGVIEENRAHCDYTQISYYFVVTTNSMLLAPSFTSDERKNKTTVGWHTLEETVKLITRSGFDTPQKNFLRARDEAALNEYLKSIYTAAD